MVESTPSPISDKTSLPTNSVHLHDQTDFYFPANFTFHNFYRSYTFFCDKYSLNKQQVALGILLSTLLIFFSLATVLAWKKYSPIIQEFITKENLEKTKGKNREGIRLDSGASSSSSQPSSTSGSDKGTKIDRAAAADLAAQAALNRIQKNEPQDASKRKIQMIAKRELEKEEENRKKLEQLNIIDPKKPQMDVKELEHSSVITKVLYSCELLGDDIIKTKSELSKDIEVFLNEQIDTSDDEHDKLIAAVLMIYSLNKTSTRQTAVETIGKYIQNILEHPGEAKYRSIRIGNKAFQERVQGAIGGKRFLEAVGFIEKKDGEESFFVFSKDSDVHLVEALEVLRNGQAVPIKFARNLEVFVIKEGQKVAAPKLADDFFNLTAEEIKKEQKAREEQVEQMLTLRTKEMKQKDEKLSNYKYKYTLIRVRLPGNLLLQGVFSCYEKFEAIREFIASTLDESVASVLFSLRDAAGKKFDDESLTLAHYGLAPAAVLHLDFAESIDRDVMVEQEKKISMLLSDKPEIGQIAKPSELLSRLRTFLPKMEEANKNIENCPKEDEFIIENVQETSSSSEDESEDDDSDEEEKQEVCERIEINVDVFREENSTVDNRDVGVQSVENLPKAFQSEDKSIEKEEKGNLIEEI